MRIGNAVPAFLMLGVLHGGCTPDIPKDPVPEIMQFDPTSMPPRVPQPTSLVINPQTGLIDLSLANMPVPADCASPAPLSQAECEFDKYLQTLDGFPTVIPATAPTSATGLDMATLTVGASKNVVVVKASTGAVVPESDLVVLFDAVARNLTLRRKPTWEVGETYWVGVRGYDNGIRAADGTKIVGSPTMTFIKQVDPLTCGATDPSQLTASCPAFALLSQSPPPGGAAATLFQLEQVRLYYQASSSFDWMMGFGLPRDEIAVLWSFPIHKASVAELDPTVGLVPKVTAADEIRVAVQGPVDPATVKSFVVAQQAGAVVIIDLTKLGSTDPDFLSGGLPATDATYQDGNVVIKGRAPFVVGHQYGIFLTSGLHDTQGRAWVPSPVSKLLTLRGALLDAAGNSTISTVSKADATQLEEGRSQLAMLFDNEQIAGLTGISRENLVYCYAFEFELAP